MKKKRRYFSVVVVILLLTNNISGETQVIAEELSKINSSVEKIEANSEEQTVQSNNIETASETNNNSKEETPPVSSDNEYTQDFVVKKDERKVIEKNKDIQLQDNIVTGALEKIQQLKLQNKNNTRYLSTQWADVPVSFKSDIAQMLLKHNDEIMNRLQAQINQSNQKLGWQKGSTLILDIPKIEVDEYGPGKYTYIKGIVQVLTQGIVVASTDGTIKVTTTGGGDKLYIERIQNKVSQNNIEINQTHLGLKDLPTNEIGYYNPWYLLIDGVVDTIDYGKKS